MESLFVVVLRYIVTPEEVEPHREGHITFLQKYYNSGHFITSGKQVPGYGGIILTKSKDRN